MTERATAASLHLIFSERGIRNCLTTLGAQAAETTVLLLQDAVYAAVRDEQPFATCLVLAEDLALRGISDRLQPHFHAVDRGIFVDLTAQHSPVVSWS